MQHEIRDSRDIKTKSFLKPCKMNRYYDAVNDSTDFAEMKLVWENLTVTVLTEDDNHSEKPWRKFLQRRRTKALDVLRAGNHALKFNANTNRGDQVSTANDSTETTDKRLFLLIMMLFLASGYAEAGNMFAILGPRYTHEASNCDHRAINSRE